MVSTNQRHVLNGFMQGPSHVWRTLGRQDTPSARKLLSSWILVSLAFINDWMALLGSNLIVAESDELEPEMCSGLQREEFNFGIFSKCAFRMSAS